MKTATEMREYASKNSGFYDVVIEQMLKKIEPQIKEKAEYGLTIASVNVDMPEMPDDVLYDCVKDTIEEELTSLGYEVEDAKVILDARREIPIHRYLAVITY